jgi:hypothetical protein
MLPHPVLLDLHLFLAVYCHITEMDQMTECLLAKMKDEIKEDIKTDREGRLQAKPAEKI